MYLLKLVLMVRKETRLFWACFKMHDLARFWYSLVGGTPDCYLL